MAVGTPPTKAPTKRSKCSKGEELFQVHLNRLSAPDAHPDEVEDDHDYPHPKKNHGGVTIGEELFRVHLKRSEGLEPDVDAEPNGNTVEEEKGPKSADGSNGKDGDTSN